MADQPATTPDAPIRVGDKVVYRRGETHQQHNATAGIYTLHSTDDYTMTGYVEIRDALDRVFPIHASLLTRAPATAPTI